MIRISLVIPTHNRAEPLLTALGSVVRQSLPPEEWECVVVDNNSTDTTAERFAEFAAAHPGLNLRMVRETGFGVSCARNRGLAEAAGSVVAFIDDDERVNETFLESYLAFFETHPGALVAGGRIIAEYPEGRPSWMSKWVEMPIANPMDFGDEIRPFPAGRVPGGGNMAFRRDGLAPYGGFDPSLGRVNGRLIGGEENDLFERLLRGGETIWYVPNAIMWHIIPPSKLTTDYFRRLSYNVGVSQRLRARIHHRLLKACLMEVVKWGATLLLILTMAPRRSRWLLRLRRGISCGLLGIGNGDR